MTLDELNREELTRRLENELGALYAERPELKRRHDRMSWMRAPRVMPDAVIHATWAQSRGSRRHILSRLRDRGIRLTAEQFETLWEMERGDE